MIIVGAKGLAKEVLQVVSKDFPNCDIVFFDDVNPDIDEVLFGQFIVLRSLDEVEKYFQKSNDKYFVLGLGNPKLRKLMFDKFSMIGAEAKTLISSNTEIGDFDVHIGSGTSVFSGAKISNSVTIGKGCLIYYNSIITHDCILGDFVEISPSVNILGRCKIGSHTFIGAASVVLPDVEIGNNVTVGAGTIVLNNVPDNSVIVGVPGKIISKK